ncbi:MAG: hypothetical protein IJ833_07925 [Lachnospiraceae bacterium]|nr:hypothetical protein [Lachnospiraceae bacterium]
MKVLSIEFTSDYIYMYQQDAGKKGVTVEAKYRLTMPTNAYVNRMLINNDRSVSDTIKNCISEHGIKCRKAIVVIPNSDSMVEEFSVLGGKRKQMDGLVEQELRKRHRLNADYLYDYIVLGEDGLKPGFLKVQVTLCAKAMIQNLYDVVKKAGLSPYRLVFTNHAMEKLAKMAGFIDAKRSAILSCVNGDEAHFLYVGHREDPYYRYSRLKTENKMEENLYVLSNITNIVDESDSDEVILRKLQGDLARLERFHVQRHPDEELGGIYFYGSYNKHAWLADEISDFLNVHAEPFNMQNEIMMIRYNCQEQEYTYNAVAAAATIIPSDSEETYDFFGKLEEEKAENMNAGFFTPLIVAGVLAIAILSATLWMRIKGDEILRDTEKTVAYLSDQEVVDTYAKHNQMLDEIGRYSNYNRQVESAIDLLENMPRYESEIFRTIDNRKPEGVIITGYDFNNGNLILGCSADDQYTPANFAKILKESGDYADVSYSGFNKTSGLFGEENYTFSINIAMW